MVLWDWRNAALSSVAYPGEGHRGQYSHVSGADHYRTVVYPVVT
jgi:hypothetical protein